MEQNILKEEIQGARNYKTIFTMCTLFLFGLSFFLTGLSSFFEKNLIFITDTNYIHFLPQGIVILFYGSLMIGLSFYLFLTIYFNVGSGYNEFSKKENLIRIVRKGFPGKNDQIFLSYDYKNIKSLKFLIKDGLNPRVTLLLILKDKREIPLIPSQFFLNTKNVEEKAIYLANFLNIPLEN